MASNDKGLTLASPRNGEIQLTPERLDEAFPEGIELLLMDRAVNTPEQVWSHLVPSRADETPKRFAAGVGGVLCGATFWTCQPTADPGNHRQGDFTTQLDTLQVLGIGLVVVTVLEGVLGSLRTFYSPKPPTE